MSNFSIDRWIDKDSIFAFTSPQIQIYYVGLITLLFSRISFHRPLIRSQLSHLCSPIFSEARHTNHHFWRSLSPSSSFSFLFLIAFFFLFPFFVFPSLHFPRGALGGGRERRWGARAPLFIKCNYSISQARLLTLAAARGTRGQARVCVCMRERVISSALQLPF